MAESDDQKPVRNMASVNELPSQIVNALSRQEFENAPHHIFLKEAKRIKIETDPIVQMVQNARRPGGNTSIINGVLQKEYNSAMQKLATVNGQLTNWESTQEQSIRGQIVNSLNEEFGSGTNRSVRELQKKQDTQHDILRRSYGMNSEQQVNALGENTASLAKLHQQGVDITAKRGLVSFSEPNEAAKTEMADVFRQKKVLEKERAILEGVGGIHKQQGLDTESQYSSITSTRVRAEKAYAEGGSDAKQGKAFLEALQKFSEAINDGSEEFIDLKNKVKTTKEAFDKGGGGNGTKWANAAAAGLNAGAEMVQTIGVNHRLAQLQNVAEFASIENDKYAMYKAARGGDVKSQMLLSQWGTAKNTGQDIGENAKAAQLTKGASGLIQFGIGATEAYTTGGILGTGNIIGGVATTGIAASDAARRISESQVRNSAVRLQMEATNQVISVHAEQVQGFRNLATGMGGAARGMGTNSDAFLKDAISDSTMKRMGDMAISPEQMTQMAQMGQANMGSMFSMEQIYQARGLEKSGYGTKEENQRRQGMLAAAGSNNPQAGLSGVLEAAFGRSLENAKTLTALVENTGQMAARSTGAASGLDVTGAASTILAAGMDPNQKNREFALTRARSDADAVNNVVTDQSMSFSNMAALTRIGKTTGLGGMGQVAANRIDPMTLKKIAGMKNPIEAANALAELGVNVDESNTPNDAAGLAKTLLSDAQAKLVLKGGIAGGDPAMMDKIQKRMETGNYDFPNTKEGRAERTAAGQMGMFTGVGSGSGFVRSGGALTAVNKAGASEWADTLNKGEGGSPELKEQDRLMTDGFAQAAEAARAGAEALGGVKEALAKLVQLQTDAAAAGGVGGEGEMANAAAESAKTFGEGAKVFAGAAKDWASIAKKLIDAGIGDPTQANANQGAELWKRFSDWNWGP